MTTECFPAFTSGCDEASQRETFDCLNGVELDDLLDSGGNISVEASISDVVDECPYQGNLFSAIPVVTCMVTDKVLVSGAGGAGGAAGGGAGTGVNGTGGENGANGGNGTSGAG